MRGRDMAQNTAIPALGSRPAFRSRYAHHAALRDGGRRRYRTTLAASARPRRCREAVPRRVPGSTRRIRSHPIVSGEPVAVPFTEQAARWCRPGAARRPVLASRTARMGWRVRRPARPPGQRASAKGTEGKAGAPSAYRRVFPTLPSPTPSHALPSTIEATRSACRRRLNGATAVRAAPRTVPVRCHAS